jgi:hypothetical protein
MQHQSLATWICDVGRKADSDNETSPALVPWKEEQSRSTQPQHTFAFQLYRRLPAPCASLDRPSARPELSLLSPLPIVEDALPCHPAFPVFKSWLASAWWLLHVTAPR